MTRRSAALNHAGLRVRVLRLASGAMLSAVACSAPAAPPVTRPVVEPSAPVTVDPLTAPWLVESSTASVSQEIRLEASLRSRVDTVERLDTIRTVVSAQWSRVAGDSPARISGLLTGFRVSADSSEPVAPAGLLVPQPFSAIDGTGNTPLRFSRPDPAGCGIDAAAVLALRDLFVSPPRRLELGTAWQDSAQYTICRDSIPLTVHSVRQYRVTGAERRGDAIAVSVERRSRVTMHGEGRQFGELLVVDAEGDGLARLVVGLRGGIVLGGDGESTLRMTMRGRRRSQELTQHSRMVISTP